MAQTTFLYDDELSLEDLGSSIADDEMGLGTLIALGGTANKTAATYKLGPPADTALALVLAATGVPAGRQALCEGRVWIGGDRQDVIAYR